VRRKRKWNIKKEKQLTLKHIWQALSGRNVLKGVIGLVAKAANPILLSSQTVLAKAVNTLATSTSYYRNGLQKIGEAKLHNPYLVRQFV
jgi:hypothetical protein